MNEEDNKKTNDEILRGDEIEDLTEEDEKILNRVWEQLRKEKERNNK